MASTDLNIGVATSARPSSRVLKPPGGGHSNIFAEPEVSVNAPRPKYNQQNSSNLNACIGSTDPNKVVEKLRDEITHTHDEPKSEGGSSGKQTPTSTTANCNDAPNNAQSRGGRIPPGGYSSGGFW